MVYNVIMLKNNNFTKILKPFINQWVALSEDGRKVVGNGKTPKEAWEKAQKKGEVKPILTLAAENYAYSVS